MPARSVRVRHIRRIECCPEVMEQLLHLLPQPACLDHLRGELAALALDTRARRLRPPRQAVCHDALVPDSGAARLLRFGCMGVGSRISEMAQQFGLIAQAQRLAAAGTARVCCPLRVDDVIATAAITGTNRHRDLAPFARSGCGGEEGAAHTRAPRAAASPIRPGRGMDRRIPIKLKVRRRWRISF
jgi:hypothetical protein